MYVIRDAQSTTYTQTPQTLHSAASTQVEALLPRPRFHLDLWLSFTFQNWILDVGRPVVMLVLPADWLPLQHPGVADYLHFLYNVTAPLILLKMLERSPWMLPGLAVRLGIIAVSMGTTLHLAADSITRRLLLIGYQLHLPVRENPIMRNLKPSALVDFFELLFYYDDTVGHMMWCVPFFLVLVLFFNGCFSRREQERMPPSAWMLLAPNAAYYWYLITEGQTFILFTFTFFAMTTTVMHQRRRGLFLNSDGRFMFYSFSAALILVVIWVGCLWNDSILRTKVPGLIYIPRPCTVYTLHLHQMSHI
uniref:CLN6 transmembrane ER protein b n=1 Tax=Neolamprologus brichardi TaxID=32507 RepID=A0A3Q4GH82_NEOBR